MFIGTINILLASGAQLAEYEVMGLHAPTGMRLNTYRHGSLHPPLRRVSGRRGSHALRVIAMLKIEGAGLAEHKRDLICETFIIVWRHDVEISRGRECAFGRI